MGVPERPAVLAPAGLVKAYIRHDMFVQRTFADFPAELEQRYGSGLLERTSPHA
jgi:hypothetical protein